MIKEERVGAGGWGWGCHHEEVASGEEVEVREGALGHLAGVRQARLHPVLDEEGRVEEAPVEPDRHHPQPEACRATGWGPARRRPPPPFPPHWTVVRLGLRIVRNNASNRRSQPRP